VSRGRRLAGEAVGVFEAARAAELAGAAEERRRAEALVARAPGLGPLLAPAPPPPPPPASRAQGWGQADLATAAAVFGMAPPPELPPPPDDPADRLAHLRWLMDVQRIGIASAKPGTAAHTGAVKLYGELQAQYVTAVQAAAAPPEIDASEAEAQLRELAMSLPPAVLEVFAVAYLDAHPALCHPEYVAQVKQAAAGLRALVGRGQDEGAAGADSDTAAEADRAPWDAEEDEA
jgi:hypothetical protein